jgi:hypothetical protein
VHKNILNRVPSGFLRKLFSIVAILVLLPHIIGIKLDLTFWLDFDGAGLQLGRKSTHDAWWKEIEGDMNLASPGANIADPDSEAPDAWLWRVDERHRLRAKPSRTPLLAAALCLEPIQPTGHPIREESK